MIKGKLASRVCVVGLGYIGLPTAAVCADTGMKVIGVDIDNQVVDLLNAGKTKLLEPGLDALVNSAVQSGDLYAQMVPEEADIYVISVPTPINDVSKKPDLSYLRSACTTIAPKLTKNSLIIIESTVPVGTTESMVSLMSSARPDLSFPLNESDKADVFVAYCPERVLPGNIIEELKKNDRIIGGVTGNCAKAAKKFYDQFVIGEVIIATSSRVAEMSKLTENSFRDVNLAFANEISMICDDAGVDVWELVSLANRHPRVNILNPGPGVGGHCIAVDPWFLVSENPDKARVIRLAREINDNKPKWVIDIILNEISRIRKLQTISEANLRVALYGLTFKANVEDVRNSPALEIANDLLSNTELQIELIEPHLVKQPKSVAAASFVTLDQAKSAQIHVFLVKHDVFDGIEKDRVGVVLDFCGILDKY